MVFTKCFAQVDDSLRITGVDSVVIKNDDKLNTKLARLKPGDKFPQAWFYNLKGEKYGPDSIFKSRPVIFVSGSYSCPIFRYNSKKLYRDMRKKSKKYDIYFIYLLEAHPLIGSPYGHRRDSTRQNKKDSIFLPQQKYVNQRLASAAKARYDFNLFGKVLADNENNDYFVKFHASPNSYLVFSKEGVLVEQRNWFRKHGYIKPVKANVNPPMTVVRK
jgi:hypothetical protein